MDDDQNNNLNTSTSIAQVKSYSDHLLMHHSRQLFKVLNATMAEFPALNGQSFSYAVLQFPNGTINPLHTHPRSSELLFVLMGSLEVGSIDTTNKLNAKDPAFALSAFGSASPGTGSVPNSVFNTTINDQVMALSFKTDVAMPTVHKIKSGFSS
ncbi:Cupin 1 [Cynara cardunculus var. scolymus]|uniref:Cupin 1 n=1 Tax=Cynara cardunculus var. scolymus TaxID=59895 RepID=A0A103XEJ0_CYNCS|nr:Cupin 1 [Cynara cardunculus var. scolymus]